VCLQLSIKKKIWFLLLANEQVEINGVVKRLKDIYLRQLSWNSIDHRSNLIVNNSIKEVNGTNQFKSIIDFL